MLAANSIDIYSNSAGVMDNVPKLDRTGFSALDVEGIVKTYVSNHLDGTSIGMTRENIESIIKSYVDTDKLNDVVSARINEAIDKQIRPLIERSVAEELLKTSSDAKVLEELVKVNIEPLADLLGELETYTRSQFAAVREELKALGGCSVVPATDSIAQTAPINNDDGAIDEPISIPTVNMTRQTSIDSSRKRKPVPTTPAPEILAIVKSFDKNPELSARVVSGLEQGFVGTALGNWLADGGFLNNKGAHFDPARLSKFKTAIEWMENQ